MGETAAASGTLFTSIDELAACCGAYCWLESRLFEVTGSWACSPPGAPGRTDPEIRVFLSAMSARHAFLAAQWHDRLPVRAGVDADALVVAPPGNPTSQALRILEDGPGLWAVLGGVVEVVLPDLLRSYEHHLAQASPVNEGPVRAVLEVAIPSGRQELRDGGAIWRREGRGAAETEPAAALIARLRSLGEEPDPAARAS